MSRRRGEGRTFVIGGDAEEKGPDREKSRGEIRHYPGVGALTTKRKGAGKIFSSAEKPNDPSLRKEEGEERGGGDMGTTPSSVSDLAEKKKPPLTGGRTSMSLRSC